MEVNRIIITVGSVSVTIAAALGLILCCVNMRHNNLTDIVNITIFVFLLIIGFVLLYASYTGAQHDRLVNILYYNTIPDCIVPPYKSEICVFSKLKKIFTREKSNQVCELPLYPINLSDSSNYDMTEQEFHCDNCSVPLLTSQGDSCQNACLGSADLNIEAAERMIECNMLSIKV